MSNVRQYQSAPNRAGVTKINHEHEDLTTRQATTHLHYGMALLTYSNWWFGWRGAMLGFPHITDDPRVPTACVSLDKNTGKVDFLFNRQFIAKLSPGDIAYIIAHECLHVVYNHLGRMKKYHKIWNIATDAIINTYLDTAVNWAQVVSEDQLDFILHDGIRWKSLPETVQQKFPLERRNEFSADDIYNALIEDMISKGMDPEDVNKVIQRGKITTIPGDPNDPNEKRNMVRKRVPLKVGDVVYVKSKKAYGVVKKITVNNADKRLTKVDVDVDSTKPTPQDYYKFNQK